MESPSKPKRIRRPTAKAAAAASSPTAPEPEDRTQEEGWTSQQASSFLSAYHKHGPDWDKVAKGVGGGKTAFDCDALFRLHHAYLSLDAKYHAEVAWLAMVQDSFNNVAQKGRSDITPSDAGAGGGSIISGGTSALQKGRRTPRGRLADGDYTPNSKVAVPRTPKAQVSGGKSERGRAAAAAAGWGSPGAREEPPMSTGKRRRVQMALFQDDEARPSQQRRTGRQDAAEQAVGIDALLSLASIAHDDSTGAGHDLMRTDNSSQGGAATSRPSTSRQGRSPGKRGTVSRAKRQLGAAAGDSLPDTAHRDTSGAFWPTISGAERDALNRNPLDTFAHLDMDTHPVTYHPQATGRRRRKPLPEKPPPMLSPIKSLFASHRGATGLALPMLSSLPATSLLQPGAPVHIGAEGETGEAMTSGEVRLRHCLSARTRRWAAAEFFYSAIDRPYFMRNELQEFAVHAGLGQGVRLTRREWGAVRGALGRPRRLSLPFLKQERAKLESFRNIVRAKYEEVGYGNETPAEMPKPLYVGQRVTARHPVTCQLHDGDVLTVAPNCYRVQFDRRELAVELVKDVDVMPIDPLESLPPALLASSRHLLLNGRRALAGLPQGKGRAWLEAVPSRGPAAGRAQQEARAAAASDAQGPNLQALAEGMSALDKKEALLVQLRNMNEEAAAGLHAPASGSAHFTPTFQRAYAAVVVQLKAVNAVLEAQLHKLQSTALPAGRVTTPPQAQAAPRAPAPLRPQPIQVPSNIALVAGRGGDGARGGWEQLWTAAQRLIASNVHQHAGAAAAAAPKENATARIISGCVSLLMVVQASAEQNLSRETILGSIERAMNIMKPQHAVNDDAYDSLQRCVRTLSAQLCSVS